MHESGKGTRYEMYAQRKNYVELEFDLWLLKIAPVLRGSILRFPSSVSVACPTRWWRHIGIFHGYPSRNCADDFDSSSQNSKVEDSQ